MSRKDRTRKMRLSKLEDDEDSKYQDNSAIDLSNYSYSEK
jgi:hypothetical protein